MKRSEKLIIMFLIIVITIPILNHVRSQESSNSIRTNNEIDGEIKEEYLSTIKFGTISEMWVGKAGAEEVKFTFTKDSMSINGEIYRSEWKEKDYCIIQVKENEVYIVGTHRYGTKAGTLYYKENKPQHSMIIKWKDQNNDQDPQTDEIQTIKAISKNTKIVSVTEVVDGDTVEIVFSNGTRETVRLLGVDTPEVHTDNDPTEFEGITDPEHLREWGEKASKYAKQKLSQRKVILRYDEITDRRGYYGRLLAYIQHQNGTNFNKQLIKHGYARVYDESNFMLQEEFLKLEEEAQDQYQGLWIPLKNQQTNTNDPNISFFKVHPDAAGDEWNNLNDEYVILKNNGDSTKDLSGWSLKDDASHKYSFPEGFELGSGKIVTVHTGSGENTDQDLYWDSDSPIWNNNGDTAYLMNSNEEIVDKESWS